MDILDDVLKEEYERAQRMKIAMDREISALPVGYISKKSIGNKTYYYLQKRDGHKIKTTYLSSAHMQQVSSQIERRKQLEASSKELSHRMHRIERIMRTE